MKRIEVYKSDNGQLEEDLRRAKAHDLAHAIERERVREPGPSSLKTAPKIDWHVAMEIMCYHDIVSEHIEDYRAEMERVNAP
jgi:hypothetical protein